jgi:hypothetical protein
VGTFTETLRLFVDADTKGAVSGMEKFGTTAKREGEKAEKSIDKWGSRLQTAGTGMIAFGSAALFGLGKMAQASEEANLSVVKLENTVGNMPKLAGENTKQFIDLADSIQDVTAADADAIVEGESLLGTFNLTAEQIKGITPLVVDYARKFGIDIPKASIQVGKALDGSIGALKKNGVSIDEALYKTDRYRAVQEALADQVGGFAEAEGKTFAGSLQRLKNEIGDLSEGVGAGAVEAFTDMFGVVGKVSDKLGEIDPGLQSTIGKVATFGAVGLIAAGGVSTLIGTVIKARDNFSALRSGLTSTTEKLGGVQRAAAITAGVAGLAGLVIAAYEIGQAANRVEVDVDSLAARLGHLTDANKEVLRDEIRVAEAFGNLDEVVSQTADTNQVVAERLVDFAEEMGITGEEADKLRKIIAEKRQEDVQAAVDQETNTAAVEDGADAMRDQADATDDAKTALQELADQHRAMFDPIFAFNDALLDNEEAQAKVIQAELHQIAASQDLAKAQREHGESSDEATDAALKLMEAEEDLEDAQRNAISSVVDYEAAFADLKAEVEQHPEKLDAAKAAIDRWTASELISAATAAFYKGEIDKMNSALARVPGAKAVTIVSNAAAATLQMFGLRNAINAIPKLTQAEIEIAVRQKGGIPIPGGKLFHGGGIVGGPAGADVPITAQAGEGVFTRGQMAAIGGALAGRGQSGRTGSPQVVIRFERSGNPLDDAIMEMLRNRIRVDGGDVQHTLGA